ncbi:MAG: hypothetical protein K2O17_04930 [Bacteroidaceae bacterium]|nr:hypothetical protein [Bacteroidaceae bacterium]
MRKTDKVHTRQLRKGTWGIGMAHCLMLLLSFVLLSCESIDCTLNNVVTCKYAFYSSSDGAAFTLADTLSITAEGTDSVLYNRGSKVKSVSLPMSYWQETDTLNFRFYNRETGLDATIAIYIKKSNTPHFESPDCPTTMFHELREVTYREEQGLVDSVVIAHPSVNYASKENIKIYLHTAD